MLVTAAVVLLSVCLLDVFLEGNLYFSIATRSRGMIEDKGFYTSRTPEEISILDDNNEEAFGRSRDEDVPVIFIGDEWAKITIETAEVDAQPVYHGNSRDVLNMGIGHYTNSRFPGQHGKVVLAGHVGIEKHFRKLETMHVGDLVTLETIYGTYVYRVTATYIFSDKTDDLLNMILPDAEDTGDRLICYTCYPYKTTKKRDQKFVIDCELISGYDFVTGEEVKVP
ncbi:MAG: class D sortase [Clostridia bacterium]|nr:class D sortase [Clostridia bacterium]